MDRSLRRLAASVYSGCAPFGKQASPFPIAEKDFRFFSYGRHALHEAFVLAGVGKGDTVLFPEYICREMLAAVNTLGATIAYYPVDRRLRLAVSPDSLPRARAIVAVNYFGFPQDLEPFEAYCRHSGVVLIEDNAHGFLGRDADGRFLGSRGDIGVFSFRKSIPRLNGSGLVVNRPGKVSTLAPQLPFVQYGESAMFRAKRWLRHLARLHMTWLLYRLIGMERKIRALRTGSDFVASGDVSERVMPERPEPDMRLPDVLKAIDVGCEVQRRRALYAAVEKIVVEHGGVAVFPELPDNVVPYGFPFHASADCYRRINMVLKHHYLDCYPWPELPAEIKEKHDPFYESIYLVNFIW